MANTTGSMDYLENSMEKPSFIMRDYGEPSIRTGNYQSYHVPVFDARLCDESFSLDKQGFTLITQPSAVDDFSCESDVLERGYPEVVDLIQRVTGAKRVDVVDHTIRSSATESGVRGIATHVHNDYTVKSCPQKLRDHLGAELAEPLLQRRVVQINAWRPLFGPVKVAPLALMDGRSLEDDDLVPCDIVYPDRRGEIYAVKYNRTHRWFYFPEMMPDEVFLFKGYDSCHDVPSRISPHTAFHHPESLSSDRPRRSIEIRTIASFEILSITMRKNL